MSKMWISPDGSTVLVDGEEYQREEYIESLKAVIAETTAMLETLSPQRLRPHRAVVAWTPEKEAELRERQARGESYSAMSAAMGLSIGIISGKCSRMGLRSSHPMAAMVLARHAARKAASA
jgi:hypothetical protein